MDNRQRVKDSHAGHRKGLTDIHAQTYSDIQL